MNNKILRYILIFIGVVALTIVVGFLTMNAKMKKQIAAFDKTPVDISKVKDGT